MEQRSTRCLLLTGLPTGTRMEQIWKCLSQFGTIQRLETVPNSKGGYLVTTEDETTANLLLHSNIKMGRKRLLLTIIDHESPLHYLNSNTFNKNMLLKQGEESLSQERVGPPFMTGHRPSSVLSGSSLYELHLQSEHAIRQHAGLAEVSFTSKSSQSIARRGGISPKGKNMGPAAAYRRPKPRTNPVVPIMLSSQDSNKYFRLDINAKLHSLKPSQRKYHLSRKLPIGLDPTALHLRVARPKGTGDYL